MTWLCTGLVLLNADADFREAAAVMGIGVLNKLVGQLNDQLGCYHVT